MGRNMGGQAKKLRSKKGFKTIDIVSYALEVSINGVTCVFVINSYHPCIHQNMCDWQSNPTGQKEKRKGGEGDCTSRTETETNVQNCLQWKRVISGVYALA